MAERAGRDPNYVTTLMAIDVNDANLKSPVVIAADPVTHRLLVSAVITGGGTSGTQYTDGDATIAHPVGTIPVFDKAGTITAVSVANPLPVTATVSTAGLATDTNQTNGNQKVQIVDAGGDAVTVTGGKLDVNATASLAGTALPISGAATGVGVAILDSSGNQISSFGGGTQYADGAAHGTSTGTLMMVDDGTNIQSAKGDSAGRLEVNVNGTVPVSGTFWQATQPISAAALPLPTGAATSGLQTTGNTSLASIDGKITAVNTGAVVIASGSVTADTELTTADLDTGAGTDTRAVVGLVGSKSGGGVLIPGDATKGLAVDLTATGQNTTALKVDASATTQPISAASLPLPTSAATSTKQSDGSQKTQIVDGSGNVIGATSNALDVNIKSGASSGTQYDEDTASTAADKITMAGVVRKDSAATLVDTDGDRTQLQVDATGRLYTNGSGVTQPVSLATNTPTLQSGSTTAVTQATGSNLHAVIDSGTITTITNVVHVDDNSGSLTVDNAGTFAVQATIAAGAAAIAKAEDVASADADVGVPSMAVRKAAPANTSGTDGDYEFLQMSAGRLWVSAVIDTALPAGANAIGKLAANTGVTIGAVEIAAAQTLATVTTVGTVTTLTGTTSLTPGVAAANLGKAEDAVHASGDVGVFALSVGNEAQSTLAADGDYIGHAVDTKGNSLSVGNLAHDAVDAGFPVKVGGQARTTNPTAVADADRVNFVADKLGKQVTVGSIRDLKGRQRTVITASTAETTIVTAVAATFLDVYRLVIANTSATACQVDIRDATAGSIVDTLEVPANGTVGWAGPESAAANQTTVNNNWTATCGTSVTSIIVTAYYVKNI
jgi:hypothetical protein